MAERDLTGNEVWKAAAKHGKDCIETFYLKACTILILFIYP